MAADGTTPEASGAEARAEEDAALGIAGFFRILSRYFVPHRRAVAVVVFACAFETGFYWIVPLAFRHLIDNTLHAADRRSLLAVLVILGVGSGMASVASLWRGRQWARVESQV